MLLSTFVKRSIACLMLIFLFSACTQFEAFMGGRKQSLNDSGQIFYVYSNTTINQLVDSLVKQEIIDDTVAFRKVLDYKSFSDKDLGAGKYKIAPHTKYKTLINRFTINRLGNGNGEKEVKVTFNNCRDVYELAGKVATQLEMDSARFVHYILADSTLQKYGFNSYSIPALFLPNTYRFYWDTDYQEFTAKMGAAFKKFWNSDRINALHDIGLQKQSEAVTLASIVYKEQSQNPEEWKTIAGLYLNRLQKGMKLQSDPTFRYCWGEKLADAERLTLADAKIDCPYNTYKYAGLPPGPICIPPAVVIDAVLHPEKNEYLFMCAKPGSSGLHDFARTYRQHRRNAEKYHEWLNNRNR